MKWVLGGGMVATGTDRDTGGEGHKWSIIQVEAGAIR